jgi:citrate synthase
MAHWAELIRDWEQRITRPRQVYVGEGERHYKPVAERPEPTMREEAVSKSI